MAWTRWRDTKVGRRIATRQCRDDLSEVDSKSLKTDNPAVAQSGLRHAP